MIGRNEDCGLTCFYHGWKVDVDGNCVEMPTEPDGYGFKNRVRIASYPTREAGVMVWATSARASTNYRSPRSTGRRSRASSARS
ncbi:hypothetical protein WPS_30470 [Vulcanimicrobium alpinum]|uniref:Rieske domain-containing protein n=1 Tax=Vulcanimicrobium alpinum TaxID=3016050 RepID=A0AAN1XYK6_UNVUL|nr:Rieske 2Fe-2S domain-containing protein [Vulcanimicrobium alpinum]BDE07771.1 hypothetical protein WPS_30470 [Vulcanimicrobium alpinum]